MPKTPMITPKSQARLNSDLLELNQLTKSKKVEGRVQNHWQNLEQVPATSLQSEAMSKELKKRGFKFVGSTICYAFMQATGMVNDHTTDCFCYERISAMKSEINVGH